MDYKGFCVCLIANKSIVMLGLISFLQDFRIMKFNELTNSSKHVYQKVDEFNYEKPLLVFGCKS